MYSTVDDAVKMVVANKVDKVCDLASLACLHAKPVCTGRLLIWVTLCIQHIVPYLIPRDALHIT